MVSFDDTPTEGDAHIGTEAIRAADEVLDSDQHDEPGEADEDSADPADLVDAQPLRIDGNPIDAAQRRYGVGGAILAAGMMGLQQVLEPRAKVDAPVVIDANSDPIDIDRDGLRVPLNQHSDVIVPAQPRRSPEAPKRRRSRRSS
jgi:hypothetical protein